MMESARKRKAGLQGSRTLKGLSISNQNKKSRTSECLRDWANLKEEDAPRSPANAATVKDISAGRTSSEKEGKKKHVLQIQDEEEDESPLSMVKDLDELEKIYHEISRSYAEGKQ